MQCNRSTTSGPPASWMPMPLSNQNPRRRPDASTPMRACIGPSTQTRHGRQEALPRRPERFVQSLERRQISTCHHLRTHKHKHLRARAGSSGPWKLTNGARLHQTLTLIDQFQASSDLSTHITFRMALWSTYSTARPRQCAAAVQPLPSRNVPRSRAQPAWCVARGRPRGVVHRRRSSGAHPTWAWT